MTIHLIRSKRAVVVPYRADVMALLPHAKRLPKTELGDVIAVKHGNDETRLLRNLGFDVPAPIVEHYDWPNATPFAQQIKTSAAMTMNTQFFVLNQMGTGKTKSALWAFDFLRKSGTVKRMLVIAPLSTLRFVWQREATLTIPGIKVVVLDGTKERRLKRLKEPADIYVVNHDGVKTILKELNMRRDLDVICVDEMGAYRNARADRSKVAHELVKGRKYVWGMSGSPTPTSPTDAFGLAALITPQHAPRSFSHFRNMTMVQMGHFLWKPRPDAAEIVANTLQPSVCFTLEDTIELPQLIERPYDVAQGHRQTLVYKEQATKMASLLREGQLTAANGGVNLSKLLQISCGWVYIDSGKTVTLDNTDRLLAMVELIDSSAGKVIVFAPYLHAVEGIRQHLDHERLHFEVVTGATSSANRDDIFRRFQATSEFDVLLAHPQCMAHGLTLTAADTIIWFSPITSLEIFEQANARISRVGQTRKQQIFMLQGTQAEKRIYQRLRQKRDVQEGILELVQSLTEDIHHGP